MPAYDAITESLPTESAAPVRPIAATDGELLMRFSRQADEGAFAELVDRHAALVWSVCRQVLRNEADVEDAFQATFLILARRAKTIRASDSAAAWLYRVAHRTAISQWRRQRRRNEEPLNGHDPASGDDDPLENLDRQHLVTVLVEELRALPERYQTPLVLCYLEGKSRSAAAEALDCTTAAIKGRLARGRRMLRSRLARRGVALSVASAAAATAVRSAEAAVATMSLGPATATAASSFVTGGAPSTALPASSLAQEGASTMFYASLAKPLLSVAALLVVGVATAVAVQEEPPRAATAGDVAGSPTLLLADGSENEAPSADAGPPVLLSPSQPRRATPAGLPRDPRAVVSPTFQPQTQPILVPTPVPSNRYWVAPQPVMAPVYPSPNVASLEQLQMERKHWELRAQGLEAKAASKMQRFEHLEKNANEGPPMKLGELLNASEARADAMLLRADAYMAQAKHLELDRRIKQLERIQQLQSRSWEQPTRYNAPTVPTPRRVAPSGSWHDSGPQRSRRAIDSSGPVRAVVAPSRAANPPIHAPTSPSRRPDLVPADPNTVVNVLVKDLRLMQEKIKSLEQKLADKEPIEAPQLE